MGKQHILLEPRATVRPGAAMMALLVFAISGLMGCTTIRVPLANSDAAPTPSPPPAPATDNTLTGNWEMHLSATAGALPFSTLSGFVDQQSSTSAQIPVVAALQPGQSSACFTNDTVIPLDGYTQPSFLGLYSFAINGQDVNLSLTPDDTDSSVTGSYNVEGGCQDGAAGTVNGTRYDPLSGTYTGSLSPTSGSGSAELILLQSTAGTGVGTFPMSGSATFQDVPCFTTASVENSLSSVIGSSFTLVLATDEASGSQINLSGTFDPAASTMTATTMTVTGGRCAGPLGTTPLVLTR